MNYDLFETMRNPFGKALQDYHAGDLSAEFIIERNDGFQERVPVGLFFSSETFPESEAKALHLCEGSVLDVGAAVGRHSLELLRRGFSVTSLEILRELEPVLRERGAERIVISDVFMFEDERFDTVLMLMNGIGMVGTPDRLKRFLRHAHQIVSPGGQILCDSMDVSLTTEPVHVEYRERNVKEGRLPGQQTFTITYEGVAGDAIQWLHIDFASLSRLCKENGWVPKQIINEPDGRYLCRLTREA